MRELLNLVISVCFRVIPQSDNIWITGQVRPWEYNNAPPTFFDNSKYFYLYLHEKTNETVYWVTSSKKEYQFFKELDLPVVNYNTLHGRIVVSRAKYSFHHYGDNTIDKVLQYGKVQMNFWHGTPLKKIAYDVYPKERKKTKRIVELLDKKGRHFLSSTSSYLSKTILANAFDMKYENILPFGYPRTDILKLSKEDTLVFCKKYSKNLLKYIECIHGRKVYLYMPTFRDDDYEYFEKAEIDYKRLDEALETNNSVFFIKLHPLTKYKIDIDQYKNIIIIDNDVDIYPFLVFTDYLITDYSSVFFDYLLLDREIIFVPYDLDSYTSKRELYFDYRSIVPGKIYECFSDFITNIHETQSLNYSVKRDELKKRFVENYNFNASERVYKYLKGIRNENCNFGCGS